MKKIHKILLISLCLLMLVSCYDGPSSPPILSGTQIPPSPTPTPVYLRPEEPIEVNTHLTYIQYPEIEGIELHFSAEHSCSDNILIYSKTVDGVKLYGYMDLDFNMISKPISQEPGYFINGLARIVDSEGVKIIDRDFNVLDVDPELPFNYKGQWTEVCILSDGRYKLVGYDENNKEIFELDDYYYGLDFDEYKDIDPETYLVPCYFNASEMVDNVLWGYKYLSEVQNPDSEFIIDPVYNDAGKFKEGLAAVKKDEKWGYINENGEVVIDFQYDHVTEFNGGIACVALYESALETNNPVFNYWGVIDTDDELLVNHKLSYSWLSDGVALLMTPKDDVYIYNSVTNESINKAVRVDSRFIDGLVAVWSEEGGNIINTDGEMILSGDYERIRYLKDGIASVEVRGWVGVINLNEEFLILPKYRYIGPFDHGYALACYRYNEAFFVDMAGNDCLVGMDFTRASKFSDDGYSLAYTGNIEKTFYIIHIENNL
ncbi:MAG: WG repeat-containing protein [Clostridia bacterium]|nr:WG repeat-containing protein [Clostridia bacterium]